MSKRGGRDHHFNAPRGKGAQYGGIVLPDRLRLDLKIAGPPVRTLADMTEDEIKAIEREYGAPVLR